MKIIIIFACILQYSSSRTIRHILLPVHQLGILPESNAEGNCVDGKCTLEPKVISKKFEFPAAEDIAERNESSSDIFRSRNNTNEKIEELTKMGWSAADAIRGLENSNFMVESAAEYLDNEQQVESMRAELVSSLVGLGWRQDAAEEAAKASNGNITHAIMMLETEEDAIQKQFQDAVADMVGYPNDVGYVISILSLYIIP